MKKKLKIAMVFSSDPSQAGGVQEHVYNLTKELAKSGHQIDIFGPENNKIDFINYHPIAKAVKLPIPNGNWTNVTIKNNEKYEASEIINSHQFDIIHIHEPYIPFVAWDIYKNTSAVKIATFHTGWNDDSIINIINPLLPLFKETFSKYFKGVIFVSKIVKKRWQYLSKKNIIKKVIYNGVDSNLFEPDKKVKNNRAINLLFVGRLVDRKGLMFLLKVINKIIKKNSNIKLNVVGDGPKKIEAEKFVKKNNLERHIKFVGEIFGKKRIKYYQNANIFCAPYSDEAFGITILEALSCGVPIVGFRNEAFSEFLNDYPSPKMFVKKNDYSNFLKALEILVDDEQKRKEIGRWGVKKVKDFDWVKVAKETEDLYYRVLERK
jgi:phosphatidylinositol alpha-mannosyltransferase